MRTLLIIILSYSQLAQAQLTSVGVTNPTGNIVTLSNGIIFIGTNLIAKISQTGSNALLLSVGGAAQITLSTNNVSIDTNANVAGTLSVAGAISGNASGLTNVSGGFLSGNTGGIVVPAGVTNYFPVSNSATNGYTVDSQGSSRTIIPFSGMMTNYYVVSNAAVGSGKTNTLTVLTNGVSTGIIATMGGTSLSNATDLAHGVLVGAGTGVSLQIITASASTAVKYAWGIQTK